MLLGLRKQVISTLKIFTKFSNLSHILASYCILSAQIPNEFTDLLNNY